MKYPFACEVPNMYLNRQPHLYDQISNMAVLCIKVDVEISSEKSKLSFV